MDGLAMLILIDHLKWKSEAWTKMLEMLGIFWIPAVKSVNTKLY